MSSASNICVNMTEFWQEMWGNYLSNTQ